MLRDQKLKACEKLHVQFEHPCTERLLNFLEDAKVMDKEVYIFSANTKKRIVIFCNRFKKPKLKPVVGITLAKEFNEMLAVDLNPYNNIHMLHHSALLVWFQIRHKK